jgi:hypothetical protein
MTTELLKQVQATLPAAVDSLPLRVIEHRESDSFGDALVVLQAGELRVRVVRDRGQVFADFGSAADPARWFDSAVVMDAMGLSATAGFHDQDAKTSLSGIAALLRDCGQELMALFSSDRFASTEQQFTKVQHARAAKQFGL